MVDALGEDESRAGAILVQLLGGQVRKVDPGGGGRQLRDLDIVFPNGEFVAVEVTRFTSKTATEQRVQVTKQGQPLPGLRSTWVVGAPRKFLVKELRRRLVPLLNELGEKGVISLDVRAAAKSDTTCINLLALGVRYVTEVDDNKQGQDGRILFNPPPDVGVAASDMIVGIANDRLAQPDNLAKLRVADAVSRDLFVWVDHARIQYWVAMWGDSTPAVGPDLPESIDRVWLVTATDQPILWQYSTCGGWQRRAIQDG